MKNLMKCTLCWIAVLAFVAAATVAADDRLRWQDYQPGEIISEIYSDDGLGPVVVTGNNPNYDGNAAVVFNSANPSGGDHSLGSPHVDFGGMGVGDGGAFGSSFANKRPLGNVMVIADNLVDSDTNGTVDDPKDAQVVGGSFYFDFRQMGAVRMKSITVMNVLGNATGDSRATIEMFDRRGRSLSLQDLPIVGENGVNRVQLGKVRGVWALEVKLNGPGAIHDLRFDPEREIRASLSQETIVAGKRTGVEIAITHRKKPSRLPLAIWVESDATGKEVWTKKTQKHTLRKGATLDVKYYAKAPDDSPAGDYWVVLGTERHGKKVEWLRMPLTVVGSQFDLDTFDGGSGSSSTGAGSSG